MKTEVPPSNPSTLFPALNDKDKKARKKNILGVDPEMGQTDEKVPLKNHIVTGRAEKFHFDIEQSDLETQNQKNFTIELIPQGPAENGKNISSLQDGQSSPGFKDKIVDIDDLIQSPGKSESGKSRPSPQFKFRPMRSGGTMLVFKKALSGCDPADIYKNLVGNVNPGRLLSSPPERHMEQPL